MLAIQAAAVLVNRWQ